MKRSSVLACLFTTYCVQMALAERMVRFIFNDGIAPTPNNQCTESDYDFIDPLFNITTLIERRRLLSSSEIAATSPTTHNQDDRALRNYPAKCKDNCAGLVPGTCRASGCQGYPGDRRLALLGELLGGNGNDKATCEGQMAFIHNQIDELIQNNTLSLPCQTFMLKSKRKSECFDDVVYGEILSFTFFTATTGTANWWSYRYQSQPPTVTKLQENATNGYSICSSIPFNIELVLNPCVNVVSFALTNKNYYTPFSRTDSEHPMALFDSATTTGYMRSSLPFGTRRLPPGSYTLKVTPDNFSRKEKV
jgi:hypothetical protein